MVGRDLRDLHANGTSFPGSIWETFEQVRSVLEPLQTDSEEKEDREGSKASPQRVKKALDEDEGSESNSTIIPRNLHPDLEESFEEESPPLLRFTGPHRSLAETRRGILQKLRMVLIILLKRNLLR